MTTDLTSDDYQWEIGGLDLPGVPFDGVYAIGSPTPSASLQASSHGLGRMTHANRSVISLIVLFHLVLAISAASASEARTTRPMIVFDRIVEAGPGGVFCHGDRPCLADLFLISQLFSARRFECDLRQVPRLVDIDAACMNLAAFQRAAPQE